MHSLLHDGLRVAAEPRVGLDRQPSVFPLLPVEDRLQHLRALGRDLLHQLPGDLMFRGCGHLIDQAGDTALPKVHFLLEHFQHDHGIAGGAHASVLDAISQLRYRRGVVPQARRRGLSHLMQATLVGDRLSQWFAESAQSAHSWTLSSKQSINHGTMEVWCSRT